MKKFTQPVWQNFIEDVLSPYRRIKVTNIVKRNRLLSTFGLVCISIFCAIHIFAQKSETNKKISAVLRKNIENEQLKDPTVYKKGASLKRGKQAKKTGLQNVATEKRYDCIVYTKTPQLLRNKGIAINSVFPAFVTASATGKQIYQMAAMPQVKYIDAPETLYLQKKSRS